MDFYGLTKKLSPTIKRIAYKLNGHYRSFSHDDLYQEAMLHLWVKFNEGSLADKTDSYLLQGCYFHLKNYIRTVNEKSNVISMDMIIDDDSGMCLEETISSKFSLAEDCREQLHIKLLAEAINHNGFDAREKKILLFLSEGLTTREIGSRIGVSHVSVVKMIQRIRVKANKHIDRDGS